MHPLCGSVATLAVASIYCIWRAYFQRLLAQKHHLHQRVAYMLWVMAGERD
jgi:hypothetical protein